MELYQERDLKTKALDTSVKQLRLTGTDLAQKEHDYKVLLRTECLKLRDEGTPVGMLSLICYGIPSVAKARLERDIAESVYIANKEAINSIKLELRLIEEQIKREYGISGKGDI